MSSLIYWKYAEIERLINKADSINWYKITETLDIISQSSGHKRKKFVKCQNDKICNDF